MREVILHTWGWMADVNMFNESKEMCQEGTSTVQGICFTHSCSSAPRTAPYRAGTLYLMSTLSNEFIM